MRISPSQLKRVGLSDCMKDNDTRVRTPSISSYLFKNNQPYYKDTKCLKNEKKTLFRGLLFVNKVTEDFVLR